MNVGFERLIAAAEVQSWFTANAAHELKTPVTVLQAGLERLPEGHEVTALRHEVRRTGRIVQQLLSLARLEGHNGNNARPTYVVAAVRDTVEPLAHLASENGVTLAFDTKVETLVIVAPPETLHEIVRTLVENAVTHAPAGSEVRITLSHDGRLTVADRGPGIPEGDGHHIFERFWRGKWTTKPGSGLGLAIVAEACERIGAQVTCAANPCGGTVLQVILVAT